MNRSRRQRRLLKRTEKMLRADDPRLGSLFAYFTGLTRGEAMPAGERIETRPRPAPRPSPVRSDRRRGTIAAFFTRLMPGISRHISRAHPGAYTRK
jgi:hypothetical protein